MGVDVRQIHLCVIIVRVSSVEIFLLMELVQNAILELEIHSFMIQIQSLSMKFKAFLITLHNPITIYTYVRYVKAIPTLVMNVSNESCLYMSQNRATIKALRFVGRFLLSSMHFESEDECECDVLACDDFTTFSNLLFDADDDFSSSDNKSFSDEDIPREIYSNPLFDEEIISIKIDPHHFNAESDLIESLLNQDSSIISSSTIDSLLDEFVGELILLKSIPLRIDEADCDPEEEICLIKKLLYDNSFPRPPKEFISENFDVAIESFSPSPILVEDSDSLRDETHLSLTPDDSMPPGIEDDDYDSERDIIILEEFLSNDSLSLPENDSFHDPKQALRERHPMLILV
uniref:Reverse transcriptase domain-containing protein n=1 Tax=Tanacetum cinerariifolium TaxID=118510 RepID=A0A699KDZ7_TANCI|nr:hypothetical protein [Tanacetum cinerariifolium]